MTAKPLTRLAALVFLVIATVAVAATVRAPRAGAVNGVGWVAYVGAQVRGATPQAQVLAFAAGNLSQPEGAIAGSGSAGTTVRNVAIAPNDGTVYSNALTSLDQLTIAAPNYTPAPGATSTSIGALSESAFAGLAVSPSGQFVYAAASDGVHRWSTGSPVSETTLSYPPIPFETPTSAFFVPNAVAVSTDGGTVFVGGSVEYSNGDGGNVVLPLLFAISTGGGTSSSWSSSNLQTDDGSRFTSLAVTPNGSALWATESTVQGGTIFRLPLPGVGNQGLAGGFGLPQGFSPSAIAITPEGSSVYIGTAGERTTGVFRVPGSGTGAVSQIPVPTDLDNPNDRGSGITGLAVTPDGGNLLVAADTGLNPLSGDLLSITLPSNQVVSETHAAPGTAYSGIAVTPDQAPHAHLAASGAVVAGHSATFDASSSTVAFGPISYHWDWSGGSCIPSTSPTLTCTFAIPGPYTVTVTDTSAAGTSIVAALQPANNGVNYTGQTASRIADNGARTSISLVVVPATTTTNTTAPPTTKPGTTTTHPTTPTSNSSSTSTSTTLPVTGKPMLTVNPGLGPPGFVTQVNGTGFPANTSVTIKWSVGIGSVQVTTSATGTLSVPMLVMANDMPGNRNAQATGYPTATVPFLVVPGSLQPGGDSNSVVFRR